MTRPDPESLAHRTVSDAEIERSARRWLELYGDAALAEARRMVAAMRGKGDLAGADMWLRTIIAIEETTRSQSR